MGGVDIRNLEDLRKHFELNAAIQYFKDGKLLKWLEARYYEDEADKISALNENAPDFQEKLCAALGVEFNEEFSSARLEEKRNILRGLTDNESIIDNAAVTALTQEDLAELLDAGTSTIYLCGNIFTVPARIGNKKYIGILGKPEIKIRANSQAELDAQNISFQNVNLPFKNPSVENKRYRPTAQPKPTAGDELKDMAEIIFGNRSVWNIVDLNGEPTPAQKKLFLKVICGGDYDERDLIYLRADKDFTAGWALTKDAFCVGGAIKFQPCDVQTDEDSFQTEFNSKVTQARRRGRRKILYKEIEDVSGARFESNMNPFLQNSYRDNFFGGYLAGSGNFGGNMITSSIGGLMIVDRDEIYWQVIRDDFTESDSFMLRIFDGNPYEAPTDKFAVLNDKIETQIVRFLNFVKG